METQPSMDQSKNGNEDVSTTTTAIETQLTMAKKPQATADSSILSSDAVTREWFVHVSGEARTYHVTVSDFTSVSPDSPQIVIGVDGRRWPVEVRYGCSAYPLCGPPCTYAWEEGSHTFELALDSMTLQPWRRALVLFCDGREVHSHSAKSVFWLRRYSARMLWGLIWLLLGITIHILVRYWTRGSESHIQATMLALILIGITIATTVLILPCALGFSYFLVGCIGMVKFGFSVVRGHNQSQQGAGRGSRQAVWPTKFDRNDAYLKLRHSSDVYDV